MIKLLAAIVLLILNCLTLLKPEFAVYLPYINIIFIVYIFITELKKRDRVPHHREDHIIDSFELRDNDDTEEIDKVEETVIDPELDSIVKALANKFYYFKESIPLIESLAKSTKDFEEKTLKKVFDQFEHIWNESETIVKESEITMKSIFDTNNSSNLGYILDSSKDINRDFSSFLPVLESMSKLTEKFINTSVDSLKEISQTTKDIEDLAEQVKVISINVRIEAARIKDSGGFKVLGEDITNFADKTSLFAKTTDDNIQHTLTVIENLREELSGKLGNVSNMVQSMYKKVNPFEEILEKSANSLKEVIDDLNKVSGELNSNLKLSLGNLQYQDVTSQETAHIIDFLKNIEETNTHSKELDEKLSLEEKNKIKRDILVYLDKISTTGNEAKMISEFSNIWNIKYKDEAKDNFDEVDDGTFLF